MNRRAGLAAAGIDPSTRLFRAASGTARAGNGAHSVLIAGAPAGRGAESRTRARRPRRSPHSCGRTPAPRRPRPAPFRPRLWRGSSVPPRHPAARPRRAGRRSAGRAPPSRGQEPGRSPGQRMTGPASAADLPGAPQGRGLQARGPPGFRGPRGGQSAGICMLGRAGLPSSPGPLDDPAARAGVLQKKIAGSSGIG